MRERIKTIGFDPKKECNFLSGLDGPKERTLAVELETQLGEDFGFVEFSQKYDFVDGRIVDSVSGESLVEVISRGGVEEETESWKIREKGLRKDPNKMWVHFSPKNESLGYNTNAVDFLRFGNGGKVVWNRVVVGDDFEDMKNVREWLGGGGKIENEMDILKSPISTDLILVEVLVKLHLEQKKSDFDYGLISEVVKTYLGKFSDKFGRRLVENSELILRLYSFCQDRLKKKGFMAPSLVTRDDYQDLNRFMYQQMNGIKVEVSFGCAGGTTVAEFGDNYGYIVSDSGKISFGHIDKDLYIQCSKCGCYYKKGGKCPLC